MNDLNHTRIRNLKQPVYVFQVIHEGRDTADASIIEVGNLYTSLSLSIDCRVILCENIWIERDLVKGSLGTVKNII